MSTLFSKVLLSGAVALVSIPAYAQEAPPDLIPDYDGYWSRMMCDVHFNAPLPVNTDCTILLPGPDGAPVEYLGASVDLEGMGWLNLAIVEKLVSDDKLGPVPYEYILRGAEARAKGEVAAFSTITGEFRDRFLARGFQKMDLADVLLACKLSGNYYSAKSIKIGFADRAFVAPACSIRRGVRSHEADEARGISEGDPILSHFAVSDSEGQWYWINRKEFDTIYGEAFAVGGYCEDGDTRQGCQGCTTTELGGEAGLPFCPEYTGDVQGDDQSIRDQAADIAALLVAELETGQNLCSWYFFVNPTVVETLQYDQFPVLQAVGDERAKQLMNQNIELVLQNVAAQGESKWCRDYRERMRNLGGPGVAMFEE